MKQLLVDQRKIVGRFDGRLTGFDEDPISPNPAYDPSLSGYLGVYSADINHYLRSELAYESDLPYEVLSGRVGPWNFGPGGNGYLYVADELRDTMMKNPHLKVLFASGHLDLATPYLATDYTIDHMDLAAALRGNIIRTYFPAGHMMYHHARSRQKLHEDIVQFIHGAAPPAATRPAPPQD
jgi:carboxypeptidase C (cathepsin A)